MIMKIFFYFQGIVRCALLMLSSFVFGQLGMQNLHSPFLLSTYISGNLTNSQSNEISTSDSPLSTRVLQPMIHLNQSEQNLSLTAFNYDFAQGPSLNKSVRVDGFNLDEGITVNAPADWEISSNATYDGINKPPYSTVQFVKNASNRTLYIRLRNDLPVDSYKGIITFSSANAITRIVSVSGSVFSGKVEMKVLGGTANITDGSTVPSSFNKTQFAGRNIGDSQTKTYTITNKGGANLVLGEINLTGINHIDFSVNNAPPLGTELGQNQSINFDVLFQPTTTGSKTAVVEIENNDLDNNPYNFAIAGKAYFCGAAATFVIAQQGFEEVPEFEELTYTTYSSISYGVQTGFSTAKSASSDRPSSNTLFSEGDRGYRIQGGNSSNTIISPYILDFNPINTSIYTNVELSIRIAAFSLGDDKNGMDNFDVNELQTTIDADKLDFVLIEVSADNGITWFQQAKVVSDEQNLAWGFGPTGRVNGFRNYEPTNSLTYFKSTNGYFYKKITILNMPAVPHLKIRVSIQDNSDKESWIVDDIRVVSTGIVPKVWNGSTWIPSIPLKSDKIIINGDYNTATSGGSLVACQCEINSSTLTISENEKVVISDILVNNGNVVVENNASFIQVNETAENSGTGTFTVKRNSNLKQLDYTYWSSPVTGQNLKQFSTGTLNSQFYTYNEGNDLFEMINPLSNFFGHSSLGFESAAKGYAIQADNNYPAGPPNFPAPSQTFEGIFKGVVNNGPITFPLQYRSLLNGEGYNLIGNPYASNIDFYSLANSNKAMIHKIAYFWTNLNPNPTMQGSNYPSGGYYNNYAILNGTGGIPATLGADNNIKSLTPTKILKVGQGFIVKAKQTGLLTFKNAIRTSLSNGVFFNKEVEAIVDRYWLHLTTPLHVTTTALIGYVEESTNDYEEDYDAALLGLGADALFTHIGDKKLGIQGRQSPLLLTDVVYVGTNHYASGIYTFSLGEREGIFANGQNVYLRDNQTGIVTNLSENNYTYAGVDGLTENRFEILYQPQGVLGTQNITKESLVVYREGNNFVVKSTYKEITDLEMFDSSGRLIYRSRPNNTKTEVSADKMTQGVYILKITKQGEITTRKIIK